MGRFKALHPLNTIRNSSGESFNALIHVHFLCVAYIFALVVFSSACKISFDYLSDDTSRSDGQTHSREKLR